jgi:hypothetical protein
MAMIPPKADEISHSTIYWIFIYGCGMASTFQKNNCNQSAAAYAQDAQNRLEQEYTP